MSFKNGKLDVSGSFGFAMGVNVSRIRFLGATSSPKEVIVDGKATGASQVSYDSVNKVLDVSLGKPFVQGFSVRYSG
jgi:alpha-glucosidase